MRARACASALAVLALAAGPASAEEELARCVQEADVREVAAEMKAQEIFPLRGNKGTKYLVMVFNAGDGLVVAENERGCFGTAIVMGPRHIERIRLYSATA